MKIKLNGTILESNNKLVIEQWNKAGYSETSSEEKKPRKGDAPLNDDGDPKGDVPLTDSEPLSCDAAQDSESKKGRKKAQE